ncbi:MAG: hypothetical protein IT257_12525 [Chitinophagaceae bacterium]|nr:hypothetical protein [Chitinophagaceae bacterium]
MNKKQIKYLTELASISLDLHKEANETLKNPENPENVEETISSLEKLLKLVSETHDFKNAKQLKQRFTQYFLRYFFRSWPESTNPYPYRITNYFISSPDTKEVDSFIKAIESIKPKI